MMITLLLCNNVNLMVIVTKSFHYFIHPNSPLSAWCALNRMDGVYSLKTRGRPHLATALVTVKFNQSCYTLDDVRLQVKFSSTCGWG